MRPFDLLQPSTLDEALALLARHGDEARLIGGGAMLSILLRQRLIEPGFLISTLGISGLDELRVDESGLHIGAAATLRRLERSPQVEALYPELVETLHLVGNVRVRNVATIGGHLAQADIHLDLPPVLEALGASAIARGQRGERRIPLSELLVGYYETSLADDEMITGVEVPRPPEGLRGSYLKFCSLSPNDWPTLGVAALLRADDGHLAEARVVVGSVSDRPLRLPDAEALLLGERPNRAIIGEVARRYARAAEPLADVRGSVEYKRHVTEVYVRRALEAATARVGLNFD